MVVRPLGPPLWTDAAASNPQAVGLTQVPGSGRDICEGGSVRTAIRTVEKRRLSVGRDISYPSRREFDDACLEISSRPRTSLRVQILLSRRQRRTAPGPRMTLPTHTPYATAAGRRPFPHEVELNMAGGCAHHCRRLPIAAVGRASACWPSAAWPDSLVYVGCGLVRATAKSAASASWPREEGTACGWAGLRPHRFLRWVRLAPR